MNEMEMIIDSRRKLGEILSCAFGYYLKEHDLMVFTRSDCSSNIAKLNEYTRDFGFLFESFNQYCSYEWTLDGHIVGPLDQALACINKPLTFSVHVDVDEDKQIALMPCQSCVYRLSVAALAPAFCSDVIENVLSSVTQLWMDVKLRQEWDANLVDG